MINAPHTEHEHLPSSHKYVDKQNQTLQGDFDVYNSRISNTKSVPLISDHPNKACD